MRGTTVSSSAVDGDIANARLRRHRTRVWPYNAGFGTYMRSIAAGLPAQFKLLEPFTRSGPLDWDRDVLRDPAVEAVYVCTPDALHQPQSTACLEAGKHVLCEKPVHPQFKLAAAAARRANRVFMVGFHRRFDAEFIRLKQHIATCGADTIGQVTVESRDPVRTVSTIFRVPLRRVLVNECAWRCLGCSRWQRVGTSVVLGRASAGLGCGYTFG